MVTGGTWIARKLLPDKHGIITKEAWEIATEEYDIATSIPHSAPIRKEADAKMIAVAVNACKEINPSNPMAVAENLGELIETAGRRLRSGICDICYEDECGGINGCMKGEDGEPCQCHEEEAESERLLHIALSKLKEARVAEDTQQ